MTTKNFKVKNGLEIPNIDSWNSTASSPSVSPSLDIDFTKGELDPRFTFNRTTTGTYQSNGPAVLAENNMIRYSEQISGSFWTTSFIGTSSNTIVAPNGTTTAESIMAIANPGGTYQSFIEYYDNTYAQSKTMTASVYLKAGTHGYATLSLSSNAGTDWVAATVNLSTGAITKTGNGAAATYLNSTITAMGNGWYRVSVSGTFTYTNFAYWVSFSAGATPTYGNYGLEAYTGTVNGATLYVWGHQVEQISTMSIYTPTNGSEVKNYVIPLKTADAMVPRFEYDPITLQCKGLLMEEQRTNLTPYSNNFAGATWGNNRVTVLNSWVIAPDGTKTGNYLLCNANGSMIVAYNGSTITAGDYVTASVYLKRGSSDWARIAIYDSASVHTVSQWFNLSTGQLGNQAASGTYFGFINAMIKPAGNGWYRCSLSCSSNTITNPYWGFNPAVDSNGGTNATAYTSYGIAWGAQFEAGPSTAPATFPTSYIPTGASAVTRAGDYAGIYEPNFSPWFNKGEGTFYLHAEGDHPYSYSMGWLGLRIDGLDGNSRRVMYAADGVAVGAWMSSYDGYTAPASSMSVSPKTSPFKAAVAYNNTTRYVATDQGIMSDINNNKFANSNQLLLGVTTAYTMARKFYKNIKYYPKALSTTELGDIVS